MRLSYTHSDAKAKLHLLPFLPGLTRPHLRLEIDLGFADNPGVPDSTFKVTLHGAAGEVTGSAFQVQTESANLLIEFGLFQGVPRAVQRNHLPRALNVAKLDAVLVTHAHLDHTGRLPLLVQAGYRGPVYATPATLELAELILRDSAKVQAQDLERANRKRQRAGLEPLEPLYRLPDVEALLTLFRPVPYDEPVPVAPGILARFVEAGHLLGSASIQLILANGHPASPLVFSGDLGPNGAPMLKDSEPFHQANTVFLESTYGDRDHKPLAETITEFTHILQTAVEQRGKILVPTFAVGRAQLLLVLLSWMCRQNLLPRFPVFLDSPMALEANRIYGRHPELFDADLKAAIRGQPLAEDFACAQPSITANESRALNDLPGPCLIMAGAGMCNAGRILHHLRQNLWRPETHVIMVGFQVDGTLGRQLVEGNKTVSIFGEKIAVRAHIHTLGGFSAHAGQSDLLRWFDAMAHCQPRVFLVHGETKGRKPLARLIRERYGLDPQMPAHGEVIEL